VTALAQGIPEGVHNAISDVQTGQLTNFSSLQGFFDAAFTFGLTPSEHPTVSQLLGALATYFNADVPVAPITLASSPADIVNTLTSVASTDISIVNPALNTALAVGVSVPTYDAGLFLNNLQTGNLLAAVGDPIAADVALVPFLVGFGVVLPIGEALATTGYELVGGLVAYGEVAGAVDNPFNETNAPSPPPRRARARFRSADDLDKLLGHVLRLLLRPATSACRGCPSPRRRRRFATATR
jgi:hypothetical protein